MNFKGQGKNVDFKGQRKYVYMILLSLYLENLTKSTY